MANWVSSLNIIIVITIIKASEQHEVRYRFDERRYAFEVHFLMKTKNVLDETSSVLQLEIKKLCNK